MNLILLIEAGTPVALLGSSVPGTLSEDVLVDFGQISHDDLASLIGQSDAPETDRSALLAKLEHVDPETGVTVKYTPQGIRVAPDAELFGIVREEIEQEVRDETQALGVSSESEIERVSDEIAERVARTTPHITSPSEAEEAAAAAQENAEQPQTEGNENPESSEGSPEPSGSPVIEGNEPTGQGSPEPASTPADSSPESSSPSSEPATGEPTTSENTDQ